MAPLVVRMEIVPFGEPEVGLWCDTCMLPAAWRCRFALVSGMRVIGRGASTGCTNCRPGEDM